MDITEQVIELYSRGEAEAANLLIDADEALSTLMREQELDHGQLIDFLIARNAEDD